jgi:hypothetical protein
MLKFTTATPSEKGIAVRHGQKNKSGWLTRSKTVYRKELSTPTAKPRIRYLPFWQHITHHASYLA